VRVDRHVISPFGTSSAYTCGSDFAYSQAHIYPDPTVDTDANRHTYTDDDIYSHSYPNPDRHTDSDGYAYTKAYEHAQTAAKATHRHAGTATHARISLRGDRDQSA